MATNLPPTPTSQSQGSRRYQTQPYAPVGVGGSGGGGTPSSGGTPTTVTGSSDPYIYQKQFVSSTELNSGDSATNVEAIIPALNETSGTISATEDTIITIIPAGTNIGPGFQSNRFFYLFPQGSLDVDINVTANLEVTAFFTYAWDDVNTFEDEIYINRNKVTANEEFTVSLIRFIETLVKTPGQYTNTAGQTTTVGANLFEEDLKIGLYLRLRVYNPQDLSSRVSANITKLQLIHPRVAVQQFAGAVGAGTQTDIGSAFPVADRVEGSLFIFSATANNIVAKDTDGTTDITSASIGDLFKRVGEDWVKQLNLGAGATPGQGGGSSTLLGLTDTPTTYDSGKFLQSTSSGSVWATVSGGGGGGGNVVRQESDPATEPGWNEAASQGLLWSQPSTDTLRIRGGFNEVGQGAEWQQVYPSTSGVAGGGSGGSRGNLLATSTVLAAVSSVTGKRANAGLNWTLSSYATSKGMTVESLDPFTDFGNGINTEFVNEHHNCIVVPVTKLSESQIGFDFVYENNDHNFYADFDTLNHADGLGLHLSNDQANPNAPNPATIMIYSLLKPGSAGVGTSSNLSRAYFATTVVGQSMGVTGGQIKIYELIGGGAGGGVASGDNFTAVVGEAITVPEDEVRGLRWGGEQGWDVGTQTLGDGGISNIPQPTITTTINYGTLIFPMYAEGTNRLIGLTTTGVFISTDNGATWVESFRPSNLFGANYIPRVVKVFGTRVFVLVSTTIVITDDEYYYNGSILVSGTINWDSRSITNVGSINGLATSGRISNFHYDVSGSGLYIAQAYSDDMYIYYHGLPHNSNSATHVASHRFTSSYRPATWGYGIHFDLIGETTDANFWRFANRIFSTGKGSSISTVYQNYTIPGGVNYLDIIVNPDNANQLILSSVNDSGRLTVQTATRTPPDSGNNYGSLGSFSTAISDGPLVPSDIGANFMSAPSASRGLYVGLGHRYSITADSNNVWTISSSNPDTTGDDNLGGTQTVTTTGNLAFRGSVHAESSTRRIILDSNAGVFITNDNGVTWGDAQRPITAAYTGSVIDNAYHYRAFKVFGNSIFLVSSQIIRSGHTDFYYFPTIYVGTVNYADRTVGTWNALTTNSSSFNTNPYLGGFDWRYNYFIAWSSSRNSSFNGSIHIFNLNAGSHSATIVGSPSLSSDYRNDSTSNFNYVSILGRNSGGGMIVKIGDYLHTLNNANNSWFSTGVSLPGSTDSTTYYMGVSPALTASNQLFLIKHTPSSDTYSLESALFSLNVNGAGQITNFQELATQSASQYDNYDYVLSVGSADTGVWIGPRSHYPITLTDEHGKVYLKESSDSHPLIGFIKESTTANTVITIQYRGLLTGLSGLSAGTNYIYEGDEVGVAISPTTVVLKSLPLD